jgi:hypothetical protein
VLLDIAAEALKADGVLLSVHLLAANDRCAAQVRWNQTCAVVVSTAVGCTGRTVRRRNSHEHMFDQLPSRLSTGHQGGTAADRGP